MTAATKRQEIPIVSRSFDNVDARRDQLASLFTDVHRSVTATCLPVVPANEQWRPSDPWPEEYEPDSSELDDGLLPGPDPDEHSPQAHGVRGPW